MIKIIGDYAFEGSRTVKALITSVYKEVPFVCNRSGEYYLVRERQSLNDIQYTYYLEPLDKLEALTYMEKMETVTW